MPANPPRAPGELAEIEAIIPTPEMIAAAWDAWMPRHKQHVRMGPGPAFREAIIAALTKMPSRAAVEAALQPRSTKIEGAGEL